jgi:radical SAM-linked protein
MTFPLPLAVGIEGADEVMELELAEPVSTEDLFDLLKSQLPRGLTLRSIEILAPDAKKSRVFGATYRAEIPPPLEAGLAERIDRLLAQPTCMIARGRGRAAIDLRPMLEDLDFSAGVLSMRLKVRQEGSASPREVLAALGLEGLEARGIRLTRTAVEMSCPSSGAA